MSRLGPIAALLLAAAAPLAAQPTPISGRGAPDDPYLLSVPDSMGKPVVLPERETYSQTFTQEVVASLPEGQPLPVSRPKLLAQAVARNLVLKEEAEVQISFVHEGAGYRNVTGFFTFPTGSPPASPAEVGHVAAFPNSSYSGSGGGLAMGDTVDLGTVPAGTTIGFYLTADGWRAGNDVQVRNWSVYSIDAFNPASDPDLKRQTVLLRDPDQDRFVIAFEDIRRDYGSCDQDFNDVILSVRVSPASAVDSTGIADLITPVDSDGDGVFDSQDDWPSDPTRAFKVTSASTTLAFEDKWPIRGDYDFNDLVVACSFEEARNAQNQLVELSCRYEPLARGAAYHNALWVSFPVAPSAVAGVWRQQGEGASEEVWELRPDQTSRATVEVFADGHTVLPGAPFANTELGKARVSGRVTRVRVRFASPVDPSALGNAPYDSFLKRGGYEVHLPGYQPSDTIDPALLGTGEDATVVGTDYTFKTARGHPWALAVAGVWRHPTERRTIDLGYRGFVPWAESGGALHADWFSHPRADDTIWSALDE
ncbi:MAG TPA: hypothetical protein DEA08_02910 [Planctomycetes bacterium]|nr:hypothetical protein [Planctomycetota bacterium]